MSGIVLAIDTPSGTFRIGYLVPKSRNSTPPKPFPVERYIRQDGGVNLQAIPPEYEHMVVRAIAEDFYDSEDESDIPDMYRVLTLPLPGSVNERDGVGLEIKIPNTPEHTSRVYYARLIGDMEEEVEAILNPPEEPEGHGSDEEAEGADEVNLEPTANMTAHGGVDGTNAAAIGAGAGHQLRTDQGA